MKRRIGPGLQALAIALLAPVVFCLVTSPILSAQQWTARLSAPEKDKSSHPANVTIQAAVDAENVRPEEISEAGQRRGRARPAALKRSPQNRSFSGLAREALNARAQADADANATKLERSQRLASEAAKRDCVCAGERASRLIEKSDLGDPGILDFKSEISGRGILTSVSVVEDARLTLAPTALAAIFTTGPPAV